MNNGRIIKQVRKYLGSYERKESTGLGNTTTNGIGERNDKTTFLGIDLFIFAVMKIMRLFHNQVKKEACQQTVITVVHI